MHFLFLEPRLSDPISLSQIHPGWITLQIAVVVAIAIVCVLTVSPAPPAHMWYWVAHHTWKSTTYVHTASTVPFIISLEEQKGAFLLFPSDNRKDQTVAVQGPNSIEKKTDWKTNLKTRLKTQLRFTTLRKSQKIGSYDMSQNQNWISVCFSVVFSVGFFSIELGPRASLKGMYVFKFGGIVQPELWHLERKPSACHGRFRLNSLATQDKPFSEAL